MKEKRRDNKGRILHTGESQRTDGKYLYKYVDAFGNTKYVSALTDIGYDGYACIEIEDRAFEGSREKVIKSLQQSKRYLEQFV